MDIEGITDFIVLAECRSFSKAADVRLVTQSAFSRRIQALENSLNSLLIDRSVTPIALTKAGERFLIHARAMAETFESAKDDVKSQMSTMDNPVYLAMPHSLSVTFFPHWYKNLKRRIPILSARVSIDTGSKSVAALRKGSADLAVILMADGVSTCFNLEDIESLEIGQDCFVTVRSTQTNNNATDFLSYPKDSYMHSCGEKTIMLSGLENLKTVFESPSSELLKAMTLAGFGISALQESLIEDDIKDGFLIPLSGKRLKCRIVLLRMKKKLSKTSEALWSSIQSHSLQ